MFCQKHCVVEIYTYTSIKKKKKEWLRENLKVPCLIESLIV